MPELKPPEAFQAALHRSFLHGLKAAAFIVMHVVLALVIIAAMSIVHAVLHYVGDPMIYDRIPVKYLFETAEVGILFFFAWEGTKDARRAFRNDH